MTAVALALLALAADTAEDNYRRGVQAFERGQTQEAIPLLREAAKLAPNNAQVWKVLGVVYASLEDFEQAAGPFERACLLEPKLVDACYYHGRNLYALNRFEPSLRVLRMALPGDRAPWRVHLGIAQALEALGQAADAERQFLTAIQQMQTPRADFDPRMHYAVFLFRQGRIQDAVAPAEAAVAAHPDGARAHFELGRLHYQLGNLGEAVRRLERAATLGYPAASPLLDKAKARLRAASALPPN